MKYLIIYRGIITDTSPGSGYGYPEDRYYVTDDFTDLWYFIRDYPQEAESMRFYKLEMIDNAAAKAEMRQRYSREVAKQRAARIALLKDEIKKIENEKEA